MAIIGGILHFQTYPNAFLHGQQIHGDIPTVVQVWHRQMQDIQKLRVNLDISVSYNCGMIAI